MRIVHKPTSLTHSYRLFSPSGKRKSFRISERTPEGKFTAVAESHPSYKSSPQFRTIVTALASLNEAFKRGDISQAAAKLQVQLVVEQLYRMDGVKFREAGSHKDNQSLVDDYMARVINRRKTKAVSKKSALQFMQRTIAAIGEVSIRTASVDELQDALDRAYPNGDQRQRQIAVNLNSLLKFAGRSDVKVERNRIKPLKVRYIDFDQLEPILECLNEAKPTHYTVHAFQVMAKMAMFTGCRIGELMALEKRDLDVAARSLRVLTQIDTNEESDTPKWGKTRTVAVFDEAVKLYPEWVRVKGEIPHEVRLRAARIFKDACKKAYPKNKDLWLKFHDLRHSFAIKNLEMGLSIEMIARQLGNSVAVCERYYVGFVHSNTTLEQTAKLLNRKIS